MQRCAGSERPSLVSSCRPLRSRLSPREVVESVGRDNSARFDEQRGSDQSLQVAWRTS